MLRDEGSERRPTVAEIPCPQSCPLIAQKTSNNGRLDQAFHNMFQQTKYERTEQPYKHVPVYL